MTSKELAERVRELREARGLSHASSPTAPRSRRAMSR